MAYVQVQDFRIGLDRRRDPVAGTPGSLIDLINGHINRGGDIERMKAWVPTFQLPAGTFGLHQVSNKLFVFGSIAQPAGLPADILYQRLQHPEGRPMVAITKAINFDGRIYAAAEFDDGSVHHFYEGERVLSWDDIAKEASSKEAVAAELAAKIDGSSDFIASATGTVISISAQVPGVPYTISKAVENAPGGVDDQDITLAQVQANTPGQDETLAVASFDVVNGSGGEGNDITSITVQGVDILGAPVPWTLNNDVAAQQIAGQINLFTSSPNYTASTSGNTVIISAAVGSGASPNGFVIDVQVTGLVQIANISNFSGGIDQTEALAQIHTAEIIGTFETEDKFTITLNGQDFKVTGGSPAVARTFRTHKSKVYAIAQSLMRFCAVNQPRQWIVGVAADDDGLVATVTPGGAGALTLLLTELDVARNVTFSINDVADNARNITVTGEDIFGQVLVEVINAPSSAPSIAEGVEFFKTITSIEIDAATTGEVFVGFGDQKLFSDIGAGFRNLANDNAGSERLTAIDTYEGNLAVFARDTIQIQFVDVDDNANQFLQALDNTGCRSSRGVLKFGNNDVFYLSDTGIRSIRARDSSNAAFVNDVGTNIDSLVTELQDIVGDAKVEAAATVLEPVDGRFMIAIGDKVLVYSFFPGSKITAWSIYEPGFEISDFQKVRKRIFARSGDTIYLYGGADNQTYPKRGEAPIRVLLPFLDADKPAHSKTLTGFDAALIGEWTINMFLDPDDLAKKVHVANLTKTTYRNGRVGMDAQASHFAPELICDADGFAKLMNLTVHYELGEDE